jgi:hypothetical protein
MVVLNRHLAAARRRRPAIPARCRLAACALATICSRPSTMAPASIHSSNVMVQYYMSAAARRTNLWPPARNGALPSGTRGPRFA